MKKILYAVETGGQVYGNQKYGDFTEAFTNSSTEYAITIGAGQWYGTEAQRLLKLIHATMGADEWNKIDTGNHYVWTAVCNEDWTKYRIPKSHFNKSPFQSPNLLKTWGKKFSFSAPIPPSAAFSINRKLSTRLCCVYRVGAGVVFLRSSIYNVFLTVRVTNWRIK